MNGDNKNLEQIPENSPQSWLKLFLIITAATTLAFLLGLWLANSLLFHGKFTPTALNTTEQRNLDNKLSSLKKFRDKISPDPDPGKPSTNTLQSMPYNENGASRDIFFTERELNGLLGRNPDLANRFVINLSDNLASGLLLIPFADEFPLVGGKKLQVTAGLAIAYNNGRPEIRLKGVSIWGVPIPNAWLGNMKNVDLVQEFGNKDGFWSTFAEGVAEIKIKEGRLHLRLKE
jgi:hypothetical protein